MTIQANQGFGVSVFGAVSGGGGGGGGTPGGLNTQVQFNSSGSFGASANLTFVSPALTIGTQQTTQGQVVFANTAAGAFATTVQSSNSASAAWTLTLPTTAGTANYALTTNGSGVSSWSQISLTAGVTGTLPLANGGTNANLTASNGGIVYSGASALAVLSGTATAGQMLRSGASGAPSWSTATFPSTATSTGTILRADGTNWVATTATYPTTTTANQLLYSSATNTVGGLTSANTSALVTNASGAPSFTSGGTANRVLRTDGTTISFAQVGLTTDVTGVLPIANGGTNNSTAYTAGSIIYSNGTSLTQNNGNLFFDANTGFVGLGLGGAAPSVRLDVAGNMSLTNATYCSSQIISGTVTGQFSVNAGGTVEFRAVSNHDMAYYTNNTERMRIKNTGEVNIVGAGTPNVSQAVSINASAPVNSLVIDGSGNVLVGTGTSPTTGTQCLTIETGTAPTATPADTVTFYSSDRSAGNTIPSFYCEGSGVTNAGITNTTVTNKIAVNINGTVYFLLATTNAT